PEQQKQNRTPNHSQFPPPFAGGAHPPHRNAALANRQALIPNPLLRSALEAGGAMERTARLARLVRSAFPSAPDPLIFRPRGFEGAKIGASVEGEGAHAVGDAEKGTHHTGGAKRCRSRADEQGRQPAGETKGGRADGHEGVLAARHAAGGTVSAAVPLPLGAEGSKYDRLSLSNLPRSCVWQSIWESTPLCLHDQNVVESIGRGNGCLSTAKVTEGLDVVDVSENITSILKNNPGPVRSFCVDSSKWTNQKRLLHWLELLSAKSVQELTIINLGHPVGITFPIQELQSQNLQSLCVGFLKIQDLDLHCFEYSALRVLHLYACGFEGLKLSWIVSDCTSLQELCVAFCTENLRINSQSLLKIRNWGNVADRFVIEGAPRLIELETDIKPREKPARVKPVRGAAAALVSISLNDVPALKKINSLLLCDQTITVNNVLIAKDTKAWNSVKELRLGLNMSDRIQRDSLRKILDSVPLLSNLSILRMDSISPDERFEMALDSPFEDLDSALCITVNLRQFVLENCRGGAAEKDIIKYVLKYASKLKEFKALFFSTCSKKQIHQITSEIGTFNILSEDCHVIFS
ncbi:hypothetical protein U9M48_005461, partial [Paspalum notatum var. saurae]